MSRTMTGESAYLRGREAFRWRFRGRRPYLPGFHRAQWFLGLSDAAVEAGRALAAPRFAKVPTVFASATTAPKNS